MTKYLLLRDNKQTGPYAFEELRAKGLKAYDLVWIDGKSAAWRYPSEVEELKPFAPAVEEQPFDRFYKKPSQNNSAAAAATQYKPVPEKESGVPAAGNGSAFTGEPSAVPGKRIIYVTLPAGKSVAALRESTTSRIEPAKSQVFALEMDLPSLPGKETAGKDRELSSLYVPSPAEEKVSHSREDLWKGAVEITPRPKKLNLARVMQPAGIAICILALLAAGIFIGLSINRDSPGSSQKLATKDAPVTPTQHAGRPVSIPASARAIQDHGLETNAKNVAGATPSGSVQSAGAKSAGSAPGQKKKISTLKEKPPVTSQKEPVTTLSARDSAAAMSLPALHREATHRADAAPIDKDAIKINISNLVSVGSNAYTIGTFGGISSLQLTVSNRSAYLLDLVVVEVQYIQANKKVFKTENLYFRGIGPGSALMEEAPKSSRGIKVQYKITLINSKELGLSYSGI